MSDIYPLIDDLTNVITRALQANATKVCDDSVSGLCVDCGVCAVVCSGRARKIIDASGAAWFHLMIVSIVTRNDRPDHV